MIVVFGGAYQGKLDFVKEKFNITDIDINDLRVSDVDYSKKVIYHAEILVRKNIFDFKKIKGHIFIFNDESCGLVPIDEFDRAYRENLGRTITRLNKEADEVYRVFFGIGERLK